MRKLILLAFWLATLLPSQGVVARRVRRVVSAAPTVTQYHIAAGAGGTSTTIAFSSSVTSGRILVPWAKAGGTTTSWNTATGSGAGCSGTTFAAQGSPSTGGDAEALWVGTASGTGACTITISCAGCGSITGAAYEVSGGTTSGIVLSSYGYINCTNCTGNALTTTLDNNLILTFTLGGGPFSSPSPFAYDINTTDGVGFSVGAGHYTQSTHGTYTPTWGSSSNQNSANVSIAIPHP